jgi:hypothetical protein
VIVVRHSRQFVRVAAELQVWIPVSGRSRRIGYGRTCLVRRSDPRTATWRTGDSDILHSHLHRIGTCLPGLALG